MRKPKQVPRNWYGYVRVSTEEQDTSGLGLESQAEKINGMATAKGLTLKAVITDGGYSAKSLERPGMQQLLTLMRAGEVAGVIISKLDRLTRSVKDLSVILDLLTERDINLISTYETLDTGTAGGRMILHITTTIAQWEREVISERTRDALRAKARRGEHAGMVRYGYRSTGKRGLQVHDEAEQAIITRITEGRACGLSMQAIADQLNACGLATRRGSAWRVQYVANVLSGLARAGAVPAA
jgi:DNA invertase Pin-like site-specific DNA recombinase